MGIVNRVKTLGIGFVFETVFESIVPAWMLRFCSLAVYQLDIEKLSVGSMSPADVKVCDGESELDHLRDYEDHDLGLSFLLGEHGAWVYSARVDAEYRRQGIYSHLMAESVEARRSAGQGPPLIGVSALNKGSHKAIQRMGILVGKVLMMRLGSIVWARSTGGLQQNQNVTFQCTQRPIQVRVP